MASNRTTINIHREIRDSLNECKKYKRETYDDILKELIKKGGKNKNGK
jgi:predicted CopG family antitoxin